MDETPKKVIRSEFFCFLCSCNLGKDQVRVFRKSAVDIARLIKCALDVDVSLYSQVNYLFPPPSSQGHQTAVFGKTSVWKTI